MKKNLAALFATAVLVAACGGNDDPPAPAPAPTPAPAPGPAAAPAVPTSATASVTSFVDYLVSLLSSSSETAQPLVIPASFTPPVSETDAPRSLP